MLHETRLGLSNKKFLFYYASRLNAVESNYTFHNMPSEKTITGWIESTAPSFLFAVKGHDSVTHSKKSPIAERARIFSKRLRKVNDDRLYRVLDKLLPHKKAVENHLKEKLGTLFSLDYDLLLYDVTSTFFEGQSEANDLAQRGYSRDHRSDCKQVNLALVVSRCGMPVGYELFAGNTADVTTAEDMVEHVEGLYGKANRTWVMDRGMTSQENVEFLQQEGRRYIIGTLKSMLKQFERELVAGDWKQVHEGLEV